MITSCQECFFAKFENNMQVGCDMNLLDKYIKAGVTKEAYNNNEKNNEFYLIESMCLGKLNNEIVKDKTEEEIDNIVSQIIESLNIKWGAFVFLKNESLEQCVDAIMEQSIKPLNITVVVSKESTYSPFKVSKILSRLGLKTWRVVREEDDALVRENYVDMILDKYSVPFYVTLDAGVLLKSSFIKDLNKKLNDEIVSFGIIKSYDGRVTITPSSINKMFGGSSCGKTLEEKLIEEKCQDKIMMIESL